MVNKMIMLIARKINSLNQSSLTFSFSLLIKFVFLKKTEIFTCSKYSILFSLNEQFHTRGKEKKSTERTDYLDNFPLSLFQNMS